MSSDFLKVFGHKLRMVRKIHFKTQLEIGHVLGKSKQTISKYEKGKIPMNVEQLKILIKYYEIKNADFFFECGKKETVMLKHLKDEAVKD